MILGQRGGDANQLHYHSPHKCSRDHWDSQVDAMAGARPASVQDLENIMVDSFGHCSQHKENFQKILTMRQGKQSIREFSYASQNACRKLSTCDDNWAMQIFTWALNQDTARQHGESILPGESNPKNGGR